MPTVSDNEVKFSQPLFGECHDGFDHCTKRVVSGRRLIVKLTWYDGVCLMIRSLTGNHNINAENAKSV
jgi:hypothetical protein